MDIVEYYNKRAHEFERIYFRPDAQRLEEQEELGRFTRESVVGRDVLEVAAGTGFWTAHAAAVAKLVTAVDASPRALAIARLKPLPDVRFEVADAFNLAQLQRQFDAAIAYFWLSHVPRNRLREFIDGLHSILKPGSIVVMADNVFVEADGGEFVSDQREDTYRVRTLESGERVEIIKNYIDRDELQALFAPSAKQLQVHIGSRFWRLSYKLAEDF